MFHLAELAAIWIFAERALALILLDSAAPTSAPALASVLASASLTSLDSIGVPISAPALTSGLVAPVGRLSVAAGLVMREAAAVPAGAGALGEVETHARGRLSVAAGAAGAARRAVRSFARLLISFFYLDFPLAEFVPTKLTHWSSEFMFPNVTKAIPRAWPGFSLLMGTE
eukprot:CAMPEP_0172602536 /NCGR_PEP_ID=MMETSP1068-20121228/22719_1 /TAXON_ID=35684 /ORGANISM="Pseudopedinella elastica, Strain CCMP716" /LENGTH=170 /DNA_ID=CAMNT_0013403925 /DNA_START=161 /DNA_END=672 /DNA_ORIENTATION=+